MLPVNTATPLQGMVPATYVRLLFDYLHAHGVDARALLGQELPPDTASDLGRYPVAEWQVLLARSAAHLQDALLGLRLGQTITPAHLGVMGYVLLSCPHLGAALHRLQEYQRLLYDVNPMRSGVQGADLILEWGVEAGYPGALVDECAIATLVQFARNISNRQDVVSEICFVNPAPANIQPYLDWFGCPVRFAQPTTTVRIPLAHLQWPLRQPDPALLHVLERQAHGLLQALPAANALEQAVRHCIARLLPEGGVELETVAAALHLSTRTLHRRLQDQGINFRSLREQVRYRLAQQYLADARLQLTEVALLLGYSEQSALTRAYKRWSGQSPQNARRQLLKK
jgi:AraC-like DNA-binding protein